MAALTQRAVARGLALPWARRARAGAEAAAVGGRGAGGDRRRPRLRGARPARRQAPGRGRPRGARLPGGLPARWWDEGEALPGGDALLAEGRGALAARPGPGLDLRLGHRVDAVAWEGGVVARGPWGGIAAPHRVVAVPLGVLRADAPALSPSLPRARAAALGRLGMGLLHEAVLRPDPWPVPGWADRAERLPATPGRWASVAVTAIETTARGRDPFARGARTHLPPGASPRDREALAAPLSPALALAGEHVHPRFPATAHGAWMSGEAAVAALLD